MEFVRAKLKHSDGTPYYQSPTPVQRHLPPPQKIELVGSRSIGVLLGRYGFNPLDRVDVWINWAFDLNDKLIDVVVEKSPDGL